MRGKPFKKYASFRGWLEQSVVHRPAIVLICLFLSIHLIAHESRPLYIQITETPSQFFILTVNIPNSVAENNLPQIHFPKGFIEKTSLTTLRTTPSGFLQTSHYEGTKEAIKGEDFQLQFPQFNPSMTSIIQIALLGEDIQTLVMGPNEKTFVIPKDPSSWAVSYQYSVLGIQHIWAGFDHLLFLLCLLIITGLSKKLFWTITGFTLAHSVTLILSTLGWIHLAIPPVEACIALSIIFLCYEIIHHHANKTSLTYRYPVLVSSSFGLLHGFGFASVLNDIGLPKSHLIQALLFFNVGVELGQLLFLMVVLWVQFILIKFVFHRFHQASKLALRVAVYGVGILASFWFFERIF